MTTKDRLLAYLKRKKEIMKKLIKRPLLEFAKIKDNVKKLANSNRL